MSTKLSGLSTRQLLTETCRSVAPICTGAGILADLCQPILSLSQYLLIGAGIVMVVTGLVWLLRVRREVRAELRRGAISETEYAERLLKNRWSVAFCASSLAIPIFLGAWALTTTDQSKGFIASNLKPAEQLQASLTGIRAENKEIKDSLNRVEEALRGNAEVRNLASIGDYSHIKAINEQIRDGLPVKTLAILYFENNSPQPAYNNLGKALADMLISDLSTVKMFKIVERAKLEEVKKEIARSQSEGFSKETRQKLGKLLGAQYIATGGFFDFEGVIRIDLRIINIETGEIIQGAGVDGNKANFLTLQKQLVWKISKLFYDGLNPPAKDKKDSRSDPRSFDATVKYAAGLDLFDKGKRVEAAAKFKEAATLDPEHGAAVRMLNKTDKL